MQQTQTQVTALNITLTNALTAIAYIGHCGEWGFKWQKNIH